MTETIYHPEVRCVVSDGFRADEVTVEIVDVDGRNQFIHIDKSMVNGEGGEKFLPIGLVKIDRRKRRVLIELPVEADSGANRMWIKFDDLRQDTGIVA